MCFATHQISGVSGVDSAPSHPLPQGVSKQDCLQQLRVLAAIAEALISVPSTDRWLTDTCSSWYRAFNDPVWPCGHNKAMTIPTQAHTHTHTLLKLCAN